MTELRIRKSQQFAPSGNTQMNLESNVPNVQTFNPLAKAVEGGLKLSGEAIMAVDQINTATAENDFIEYQSQVENIQREAHLQAGQVVDPDKQLEIYTKANQEVDSVYDNFKYKDTEKFAMWTQKSKQNFSFTGKASMVKLRHRNNVMKSELNRANLSTDYSMALDERINRYNASVDSLVGTEYTPEQAAEIKRQGISDVVFNDFAHQYENMSVTPTPTNITNQADLDAFNKFSNEITTESKKVVNDDTRLTPEHKELLLQHIESQEKMNNKAAIDMPKIYKKDVTSHLNNSIAEWQMMDVSNPNRGKSMTSLINSIKNFETQTGDSVMAKKMLEEITKTTDQTAEERARGISEASATFLAEVNYEVVTGMITPLVASEIVNNYYKAKHSDLSSSDMTKFNSALKSYETGTENPNKKKADAIFKDLTKLGLFGTTAKDFTKKVKAKDLVEAGQDKKGIGTGDYSIDSASKENQKRVKQAIKAREDFYRPEVDAFMRVNKALEGVTTELTEQELTDLVSKAIAPVREQESVKRYMRSFSQQ